MNIPRLSAVVFLLSITACALAATPAPQPANYAAAERVIRDPQSSDTDAMNAILAIRKMPFRPASAKLWTDVANSDAFSADRRRWAVIQLFDRNVLPGMTLAKVGELLNKPTWLKPDDVRVWVRGNGIGGYLPLIDDLIDDGGIVSLRHSLTPGLSATSYFSVVVGSGEFSKESVFAALMSQPSAAANWHIHRIAMMGGDDRLDPKGALIRHEFTPYDHAPDAAVATLAEITQQGATKLAILLKSSRRQENGEGADQPSEMAYEAAANDFDRIVSTIQMDIGARIAKPDTAFNIELEKFANDMMTLTGQVPDTDQTYPIREAAMKIMETSRPLSEDNREIYERNLDRLKWPTFADPTVTR